MPSEGKHNNEVFEQGRTHLRLDYPLLRSHNNAKEDGECESRRAVRALSAMWAATAVEAVVATAADPWLAERVVVVRMPGAFRCQKEKPEGESE